MGESNGSGESTGLPPESSSSSGTSGNDVGDFECNICFELAQDPIVTLCGHLFCWPCLYRWLNYHSNSHECPVCKAVIEEEKLVPLYGRGRLQSDPRGKSYPGMDIPRRPIGPRPNTAIPREANDFSSYGFGPNMGGMRQTATATARNGNFNFSAALGTGLSLFPSLFNFQFQGFSDATVYGTTAGYPYGFHAFHGGHAHRFPHNINRGQNSDYVLKNLLLLVGFLVIVALLLW